MENLAIWGPSAVTILSLLIAYTKLFKNIATKDDIKELKKSVDNEMKEIKALIEKVDSDKVDKETFEIYKMYVEEKCKN